MPDESTEPKWINLNRCVVDQFELFFPDELNDTLAMLLVRTKGMMLSAWKISYIWTLSCIAFT